MPRKLDRRYADPAYRSRAFPPAAPIFVSSHEEPLGSNCESISWQKESIDRLGEPPVREQNRSIGETNRLIGETNLSPPEENLSIGKKNHPVGEDKPSIRKENLLVGVASPSVGAAHV
jgi:hypothetical protein